MPWVRYTIAMLIGCVAWALIYATVGFATVEAGIALATHSPWMLVAVVLLVVAVVVAIVIARRRRSVRGTVTVTAQGSDSQLS
jgi:membrane protein DedA with SNARE-associated domain